MDRRYLLEGTMVALLILGPSVAAALALDLDEGSIAEWVAAVATVAAVIAAVYAGLAAKAALNIELKREGDRLTRDRQDQAARVAAWASSRIVQPEIRHEGRPWRDPAPRTEHGAMMRNASDVPVTDVVLHYVVADGMNTESRVGLLPPAEAPKFHIIEGNDNEWWDVAEAFELGSGVGVEVSFRDARGQAWTRSVDGQLVDRYAAWRLASAD
ncbi:MAG: hypothetical protein KAG80_10035 [Nocardioides sp.]|nr:hypothetical protein [Nocardioides sp.]